MKTAIAIRHVPFEDLGSFAHVLSRQGYTYRYCDAGVDDFSKIDPLEPDLVVVLGGPIGANDEAVYPFLLEELRLIEKRLQYHRPTLGVCLGSQLMARALGARVYSGVSKEIGWGSLVLTRAGTQSCLRHLSSDKTSVLHWHGDTFDLPTGAKRLASTSLFENQAFSWGRTALALQFHAEARQRELERWFIGHTCEIALAKETTVEQLRADAAVYGPALERQGELCLAEWLLDLEEGFP